jgi:cytochrome P450
MPDPHKPHEPSVSGSGCPHLSDVNFFDRAQNDCPYPSYETLRNEAPVWQDPRTKMYVLTRYEDVKMVLLDTERFSSVRPQSRRHGPLAEQVLALYQTKGWVPGPTLAGRDDPNHKQMRTLFNHAYRPNRIKELEPTIERFSNDLIDAFIERGQCDFVREFAIPLPLLTIGVQVGADLNDIWKIKGWTDAWVQRLGMMQTPEEVIWSTEQEIEAQQYFQRIFERLRAEPNDTLLSDLVNTEIPEWGRKLTDEELHAEMMADTFVGGSETTTNALSAGIKLLIEHPAEWAKLKADPEKYLPVLVEEALRLESPVQALFRTAAVDIELHGVTIPAGSPVSIRYGAANRDERQFSAPDAFDLDRQDGRSHIAFGHGIHHCLGAPLARRELLHGFRAVVQRLDNLSFVPDANDFSIAPNYSLRALNHLHIAFTPAA